MPGRARAVFPRRIRVWPRGRASRIVAAMRGVKWIALGLMQLATRSPVAPAAEIGLTVPYTPIRNVAALVNASVSVNRSGEVIVTSPWREVVLGPNVRLARVDGFLMYLNAAFVDTGGDWSVSAVDASDVLLPLFGAAPPRPLPPYPLVVIDPGHGGDDSGAVGPGGLAEKTVVLSIARRLADSLRESGIPVRLTRTDDRYLSLSERTTIARRAGASLFISIHLNASANRDAGGAETYMLPSRGFPSTSDGTDNGHAYRGNQYDTENARLAFAIHRGLLTYTGAVDRGIRRARFEVLREAPCPAVLVECGFITHRHESSRLRTPEHLDRLAAGLSAGVATYVSRCGVRQSSDPEKDDSDRDVRSPASSLNASFDDPITLYSPSR
jgi:N-acetylmuramoyl-L-alanine amidase